MYVYKYNNMLISGLRVHVHVCVDSTGTGWLPGMKSVCTGSHDYHMTFTALETLLTLLAYDSGTCTHTSTLPSCDVGSAVSVLCPDVATITKDTTFIEVHVHG